MEDGDLLFVDRFANSLRARIEAGEFGTGGALPSQTELMAEWGIKNRAMAAEVMTLLRVQGYITSYRKRYHVVHPRFNLQGLTPNFATHLEDMGFRSDETDIQPVQVEELPLEVAQMFPRSDNGEPAIQQGVHVVHRVRKQGIINLPLRIGHIWYPLSIAEPYLEDMQYNPRFDVPAALKTRGIIITEEDSILISRVPTLEEMGILSLSRYHPLLEVRRICYDKDRLVVTLHRTIMDGTRFEYRLSRSVNHWK